MPRGVVSKVLAPPEDSDELWPPFRLLLPPSNLCAQPARGLGKSMVVIDLNQAIKRQARAARRAAPCARGRTRDSERTTDLQNRWSTCQRACDLLSNDQ